MQQCFHSGHRILTVEGTMWIKHYEITLLGEI
jgi:hypothetical protein